MNTTQDLENATADLARSLARLIRLIAAQNRSDGILAADHDHPTQSPPRNPLTPVPPEPKGRTTDPIQIGDVSAVLPEFGRHRDVERLFGIKRGTLYNLLADGKVKGVLLRVRGQKSGLRLIHLESVRSYIQHEMSMQRGG